MGEHKCVFLGRRGTERFMIMNTFVLSIILVLENIFYLNLSSIAKYLILFDMFLYMKYQ